MNSKKLTRKLPVVVVWSNHSKPSTHAPDPKPAIHLPNAAKLRCHTPYQTYRQTHTTCTNTTLTIVTKLLIQSDAPPAHHRQIYVTEHTLNDDQTRSYTQQDPKPPNPCKTSHAHPANPRCPTRPTPDVSKK